MQDLITNNVELSNEEFKIISEYIETNVGIRMPPTKRIMMQSRLLHRLKKLGIKSFSEYIDYTFHKDLTKKELVFMTDVLTTNKTEFFRENDHFEILSSTILDDLYNSGRRNLNIWSAGCSTGEEVYTLAIVLKEFMENNPGEILDFNILGTDISTRVLDRAVNGVYEADTVTDLPLVMKRKYFLKSKNPGDRLVRIKPALRKHASFQRLNFMDEHYNVRKDFNIIFCRNVLIYFDKETQKQIIEKFCTHLADDGYLFLGHSETILSMKLPLKLIAPTVYRKTGSIQSL